MPHQCFRISPIVTPRRRVTTFLGASRPRSNRVHSSPRANSRDARGACPLTSVPQRAKLLSLCGGAAVRRTASNRCSDCNDSASVALEPDDVPRSHNLFENVTRRAKSRPDARFRVSRYKLLSEKRFARKACRSFDGRSVGTRFATYAPRPPPPGPGWERKVC
jgi:hypothetical protein